MNTSKIDLSHRFDVVFNDSENSDSKGFSSDFDFCMNYINRYNGTNESYFADYKNGSVSILDIDSGDLVYTVDVL